MYIKSIPTCSISYLLSYPHCNFSTASLIRIWSSISSIYSLNASLCECLLEILCYFVFFRSWSFFVLLRKHILIWILVANWTEKFLEGIILRVCLVPYILIQKKLIILSKLLYTILTFIINIQKWINEWCVLKNKNFFIYLLLLLNNDFLKIKSQLYKYQNSNHTFLIKRSCRPASFSK